MPERRLRGLLRFGLRKGNEGFRIPVFLENSSIVSYYLSEIFSLFAYAANIYCFVVVRNDGFVIGPCFSYPIFPGSSLARSAVAVHQSTTVDFVYRSNYEKRISGFLWWNCQQVIGFLGFLLLH